MHGLCVVRKCTGMACKIVTVYLGDVIKAAFKAEEEEVATEDQIKIVIACREAAKKGGEPTHA